jgi:hypothetical protein
VSVLSRKRVQVDVAGTRERALSAARQAAPVAVNAARQVGPVAKSAGQAARQGTETAVAWATPRVNQARGWAAPRIERGGIAVQETVAPKVAETLVAVARALDTAPPRRRRWPRVLGAAVLLAAAGTAVAAVALRRRSDELGYDVPGGPADADAGSPLEQPAPNLAEADGSQGEAEVNGHFLRS